MNNVKHFLFFFTNFFSKIWLTKKTEAKSALMNKKSESSPLVCFCHGVTEEEICQAIKKGCHTLELIQNETLASTGCGGCAEEVKRLLEENGVESKIK